jgi:hypothetical protein
MQSCRRGCFVINIHAVEYGIHQIHCVQTMTREC